MEERLIKRGGGAKKGAGRVPNPRTKVASTAVSEREFGWLALEAERDGITISQLLRRRLVDFLGELENKYNDGEKNV